MSARLRARRFLALPLVVLALVALAALAALAAFAALVALAAFAAVAAVAVREAQARSDSLSESLLPQAVGGPCR